jgi:hypothetical protein
MARNNRRDALQARLELIAACEGSPGVPKVAAYLVPPGDTARGRKIRFGWISRNAV